MYRVVYTVPLELLPVTNRNCVLTAREDSIKAETDKDRAYAVHREHIRKKKVPNQSALAFQFVVMAHIHQQDWCHVWNVHVIRTPVNHQLAVSRIVKHVQLQHLHSNLPLPEKTVVDRNAHPDFIPKLVLLHAQLVLKTSTRVLQA